MKHVLISLMTFVSASTFALTTELNYDCAYSIEAKNRNQEYVVYQGRNEKVRLVLSDVEFYSEKIATVEYNDPLNFKIALSGYFNEQTKNIELMAIFSDNVGTSAMQTGGGAVITSSLNAPAARIELNQEKVEFRQTLDNSLPNLKNLKLDCRLRSQANN